MQEKDLVQATIRIRKDQKSRLSSESISRGGTLADIVRDNLDLAFAVKSEMAKVIEGEFDESDPTNAPRLVHTLLYRVEERILSAIEAIDRRPVSRSNSSLQEENGQYFENIINAFLNALVGNSEYEPEVWIGSFLEIVSRLEFVPQEQLRELSKRGEAWLSEKNYYSESTVN